jgi:hypothetical protein
MGLLFSQEKITITYCCKYGLSRIFENIGIFFTKHPDSVLVGSPALDQNR